MKTWTMLLMVVMMAVVVTVVAMEEEDNDDWFENMIEEYKRRPRPPPPRHLSSGGQCLGYGKTCSIKNRRHNCCQGLGCYGGHGTDCYGTGCMCMRTPALRWIV